MMIDCQAGAITRARIVRTARSWLGTPYHHQASVRGVGTDCIGLVRGVWRELYGFDAEQPPAYSPDWAEAGGRETLLAAAHIHMRPVSQRSMQSGDVLVFRFRGDVPAKHTAILVSAATMVHAAERAPVCEVPVAPWWRRRIAGVFSFPGVCTRD